MLGAQDHLGNVFSMFNKNVNTFFNIFFFFFSNFQQWNLGICILLTLFPIHLNGKKNAHTTLFKCSTTSPSKKPYFLSSLPIWKASSVLPHWQIPVVVFFLYPWSLSHWRWSWESLTQTVTVIHLRHQTITPYTCGTMLGRQYIKVKLSCTPASKREKPLFCGYKCSHLG